MVLGDFLQPGDEVISIGATDIRYGTASTQSVFVGTTTFTVTYDGVNSISVTEVGGGLVPSADMDAFVRLISYSNESATDLRGNRTIQFTVDDASGPGAVSVAPILVQGDNLAPTARDATVGGTDTALVSVNVVPVNDAPVLDLNGAGAGEDHADTYVEDGAPVPLVAADATLDDVDSALLVGLDIVINNAEIGDTIVAGALPGGINVAFSPTDANTGLLAAGSVTISLTGAASAADYQTALRGFLFSTVSDTPVESTRTIVVTADDGFDVSVQRVSSLTVQANNDAPVAQDDTLTAIDEDTTGIFSTADLLANDSDPESDQLTVVSLGTASNGTVTLLGTQITYVPNPDFFGQDTFTYRVVDGQGGEATRTATVTVTAVNDVPLIDLNTTDGGGVDFSTNYTENLPDIAVVDPSVQIVDVDDTLLERATLVLTDGQIGDFLNVGVLPGSISATITPPGPLTSAQSVTIEESGPASAADYMLALQAVTYRSTSDALRDSQRTIDIRVDDGDGLSTVATTSIAVTAVNDDPVAVNDSTTILEDGSADFTIAQLLSNDIDADEEPLTIVGIGAPSIGTVSQAGNVFTFTPPADYYGPASFTYAVEDGAGDRRVAWLKSPPPVQLRLMAPFRPCCGDRRIMQTSSPRYRRFSSRRPPTTSMTRSVC